MGMLALALIFFFSGAKFLQDSKILEKRTNDKESSPENIESRKYDKRKFLFSLLMFFVGILVILYYIITV